MNSGFKSISFYNMLRYWRWDFKVIKFFYIYDFWSFVLIMYYDSYSLTFKELPPFREFFTFSCVHFSILTIATSSHTLVTEKYWDYVMLYRKVLQTTMRWNFPTFKPLNKFALFQLHADSPQGKLTLFLYKYFEGSKEAYDFLQY